jgi:hypothetical protein
MDFIVEIDRFSITALSNRDMSLLLQGRDLFSVCIGSHDVVDRRKI